MKVVPARLKIPGGAVSSQRAAARPPRGRPDGRTLYSAAMESVDTDRAPAWTAVPAAARRAAREAAAPLVLAVSGGRDSMALLVAMASAAHRRIAAVATFDHGTGAVATDAAAYVARVAAELRLPCVVGHMPADVRAPDGWEAAWRVARHAFLGEVARETGGRVVTAHTADDQVETVLMRVLRGSGARGLAGLAAASLVLRPFLGLRRAHLTAFLEREGRAWVDDPSNESRAFLRNRVRHELLPALRRFDPTIDAALLATGQRAAEWRRELDALVDVALRVTPLAEGGLSVASAELRGYDRDSLAMLWGAVAGRAGLALDRRGTHRLATFIINGRRGSAMPLSGGWMVEAHRDAFVLRRGAQEPQPPAVLPASGAMAWGRFRFRRLEGPGRILEDAGSWSASLPAAEGLRVRAWRPGDRLAAAGRQPRRRVTRYLSEAGVQGSERAGWPVVVAGGVEGEVVWIPGVRRADAATERSGRPVRHYVCERIAP